MKAVILAGGRGTRLRPITDYVPKPLVPVCNVPIMEWQIKYLLKFGISEIVVCTGYKTGMIKDRLGAKDHGAHVIISAEDAPLGTGGAIRAAAGHIGSDDTFVVLNGDVITDIDIGRLARVRNSIATIPLRTNYGTLDITCDGPPSGMDAAGTACTVVGFREKQPVSNMWMNAGIYHLGREVLADLPAVGNIESTLFPEYARRGTLKAVRYGCNGGGPDVMWQSVDSFKDLETCNGLLARARR